MDRFGEKLRQLRTGRNLTLKVLSGRLGYSSHSYLQALESGKKTPTALFVLKVSRFFDVTTDQLLKDELDING
ncbi:MAG: helix-turn-helix transcriptional regulator [Bacteroidota bacterium]